VRWAPEGRPWVAGAAAVLGVAAAWAFARPHPLALGAAAVAAVALGAFLFFFRDPERPGARGPAWCLAPADGRVVDVSRVEEPKYLGGPAHRVAIFLSVLDVHVNRYPVSGVVEYRAYERGRFGFAWRGDAGERNERASVGIASPGGRVLVRQVAGTVARRIVTYARLGERVEQGERMGIIRFGSRVEVFLPSAAVVTVRRGDRVRAGQTVLAEWRPLD
jgi:phosphatidylserine decarboxylase